MRALLLLAAACNLDSDLAPGELIVGGEVRGLWTGAEPVTLTLRARGIETVAHAENGTFAFDTFVPDGVRYEITAAAPPGHECDVIAGTGTLAGANVTDVAVACRNPAMTLDVSLPTAFAFDPSAASQQAVEVSVVVQNVAFTLGGDITGASVDGVPITAGDPADRSLALGRNEVVLGVEAGALSTTFTFTIDRAPLLRPQAAYVKASNTGLGDNLGHSVAVFRDRLAIGAPTESSDANTIDGDQNDDSASGAGAVYVFRRTGTTWVQEAYIKASNSARNDRFGTSVSLHGDRLAVGAPFRGDSKGAVYVFRRDPTGWIEEQILVAGNEGLGDRFGFDVALFDDRLVAGAPDEDSDSDGIDSVPDEAAPSAGAAYVFRRTGTVWEQEAYVKAINSDGSDQFGARVAISGDTLAIAAPAEASNQIGVQNGTAASSDNSSFGAGAVYVYQRTGTTWVQRAYVKSIDPDANDTFGCDVAIDRDTLVASACLEDGGGIDTGAVYTYARDSVTWTFDAVLTATNRGADDRFGSSVAVAGDLVAVGAPGEDSSLVGIDPPEPDNDDAPDAGAVYVFRHSERGGWGFGSRVKAQDAVAQDHFGEAVALSGDTLVTGAPFESSRSKGIDGNPTDTSTFGAGAAYLHH